jgi:hypothetical protein
VDIVLLVDRGVVHHVDQLLLKLARSVQQGLGMVD